MLIIDTICALATPIGTAGLAVVRLSGDDCLEIADKCFRAKTCIAEAKSHTILYGKMWNGDIMLDTVVASVFRAPNSYTGEDVVEFGCHGGMIVSGEIVQALIEAGARPAAPGEFTKRAFLNQKMDLTQVEAVGDLIHAVSTHGSHTAARQLMGGFTKKLSELREQLLMICGLLELELDFSQEDIELINRTELCEKIEAAQKFCRDLAESHRSSEILRAGYAVGIAGYPNAGKSSLLNALVGRKRAIVSNVPGTTRDYIEEALHLGGMAVKLMDTAGFRESRDVIEIEGIQLAESLLEQCNLILVLNDITLGETHSQTLLRELQEKFPSSEFALVQNKIDQSLNKKQGVNDKQLVPILLLSAQTGQGVQTLKDFITQKALENTKGVSDALLNARQAALLNQAAACMQASIVAVNANISNEFVAIDLREALKRIGEITGSIWNEDILNSVFSKFCIGK